MSHYTPYMEEISYSDITTHDIAKWGYPEHTKYDLDNDIFASVSERNSFKYFCESDIYLAEKVADAIFNGFFDPSSKDVKFSYKTNGLIMLALLAIIEREFDDVDLLRQAESFGTLDELSKFVDAVRL